MSQGIVLYPNLGQWESFYGCDISGISPSTFLITCYLGSTLPAVDGNLTLIYDAYKIVFPNCHLESFQYHADSGGNLATIKIVDERWRWASASITLRANIRLPNNFVDPAFEATPQQLASACFEALGVAQYDVSTLPNDARPDVDWDHSNPAQELAKICDDLGCRIIPERSTGIWRIVVTGVGKELPNYPIKDAGTGLNPKLIPDYIKIVSAPILWQYAARLAPVARDIDLSWRELADLSYKPPLVPDYDDTYGLGAESLNAFANIDPVRLRMQDGTLLSPQEVAQQTVLRCWRIYDPEPFGKLGYYKKKNTAENKRAKRRPNEATIKIPGFNGKVFRKQIILTNSLVQTYTDAYGEEHKRPSFMFGSYRGNKCEGNGNYPLGRRIDAQTARSDQLSLEEQESYSLFIHPIDSDKSIITVSRPLIRYTKTNVQVYTPGTGTETQEKTVWAAAKLWYMAAVQIRDLNTWQPIRNEFYYQVGTGTDKNFCKEVVRNDIQPWYIAKYDGIELDSDGEIKVSSVTHNAGQVAQQSLYYAQQIAQTFRPVTTGQKDYIGIYPVDLDGAIQQITFRMGRFGADTTASRGNEHNFQVPDYWTRRFRDGNFGAMEKLQLQMEIKSQRDALRGSFNT